MAQIRQYDLEGLIIDIPFYENEKTGKPMEVYPDFLENPIWTPKGHRVLFCGTDACAAAVEATPGGCFDCGSCKYFKPAAAHTWFGMCTNRHSPLNRKRKQHKNK